MNLNLQDALALLYTGSGSQRAIARSLGISHQKVGRILRTGQEGGFKPNSRALSDPALISNVNKALRAHSVAVEQIAKLHGLPYDYRYPVLMQRMAFADPWRRGVPGDRVDAKHTHWLSNDLRAAWLAAMYKSGRFYQVSGGSIVDFARYNKSAQAAFKGKAWARSDEQKQARKNIEAKIEADIAQGLIQTPYVSFDKPKKGGLPASVRISELMDLMNSKHAAATGEDMTGTAFASRFLFQIDTRAGKDDKFRKQYPIPPRPVRPSASPAKTTAPKPKQARGSARQNQPSITRKR